jgi:hypothetical protein
LTDAELLAQAIVLPLLDQVLAQANEQHAVRANWQPLLCGLYLWQVWDLDLPLAAWQKDMVQWLYVDLPTTSPGQPVALPESSPQLCALHCLWVPSPAQVGIPFVCTELDGESWFFSSSRNPRYPPTHLG